MKMLMAIDDALCFLFSCVFLFLNLNQESLEMGSCHKSILGVLIEKGLDLRRRFPCIKLEPPPTAEADSVSLFRHEFSLLTQNFPTVREAPKRRMQILWTDSPCIWSVFCVWSVMVKVEEWDCQKLRCALKPCFLFVPLLLEMKERQGG